MAIMNQFEKGCNEIEKDLFTGESMQENAINFIRNAKTATVNFSQGRYVSKIKKYAEERPDECEIVAENKDGTIVAHIPVKWIKITPTRQYTEEERERMRMILAERFGKDISDVSDDDVDEEESDMVLDD